MIPMAYFLGRVFANDLEERGLITGRKTPKWYLMPPCLILNIIRYGSRIKKSYPEKREAPSTTTWCCSWWKGSLRVAFNNGRQLYLYIRGAFNKFPDFCVQVFKIVVDSWKFSMLLLYMLWDDWLIFMISGSNEQLQMELEYTLLKPDCHS